MVGLGRIGSADDNRAAVSDEASQFLGLGMGVLPHYAGHWLNPVFQIKNYLLVEKLPNTKNLCYREIGRQIFKGSRGVPR